MWCRVLEFTLGCWLAMSPFIFHHPSEKTAWWVNDLCSAAVVVTLSLASFWRPLHWAHYLLIAVGFWLIGFAWLTAGHPAPPALHNNLLVGLFLLMFAILPNDANAPPASWEAARSRGGQG